VRRAGAKADKDCPRGRVAAKMTLEQRIEYFMTRVVAGENGCWLWQGTRNNDGYGVARIQGRLRCIHQVLYEHHVGPRGDGNNLHHMCEVRHCVNPAHLELLPIGDHARVHLVKTHCKRGHELTPDNIYLSSNGSRSCRACSIAYREANRDKTRARNREYMRRKRSESAATSSTAPAAVDSFISRVLGERGDTE
jgi:HNH endonuclease